MIEMPPEKSPEKITRRPGFGVSVMRGLMTLSRLYTRYGRSGYIPRLTSTERTGATSGLP